MKGLFARPERLIIDIKYKDYQKLAYKREIALERGILITEPDDYVPAKIRHGDKTYNADVRLKGDWLDHLQRDKWSFRIKIKGEDTIFGMKVFSIQHPKTRRYIYEWLFHQVAGREGLISLRYKFVNVTLNGKNLGVYALEEHFEKRLIENNRRLEGPIIKFNESNFWAERLNFDLNYDGLDIPETGSYGSLPIDMFQENRTFNDPVLFKNFVNAQNLLEQFRRGALSANQVFDVDNFARYIALCDLFGSFHSLRVHQLRFYYNPVLSLLEPIPFDLNAGDKLTSLAGIAIANTDFFSDLFKEYSFWETYLSELERFSEPAFLNDLFLDLGDEMNENINIIYSEFPWLDFPKDLLYQNQDYIRKVLSPVQGLHAYFNKSGVDRITLELGNIQQIPVEVLNVSYQDSISFRADHRIILPGKTPSQPIAYQNVDFMLPTSYIWSDILIGGLKINYKLLGTSRLRNESVFAWSHLDSSYVKNDFIRKPSNADLSPFLEIDETNKKITFKPGKWTLNQNLVIPEGYKVAAGEGTELNLSNSAKILSYSPVEFIGSIENPVLITADSSGQGLVVLNAARESTLQHVQFSNLSVPKQGGWELTGAVTFYESPVMINNCLFAAQRSEDALHIVRSKFRIDSTSFKHVSADAFDADFSNGEIMNSSFVNCGNDAVDVSGSAIEISNIYINGAGDKGLSAGESSQLNVKQAEIVNAEVGVASKDNSKVDIDLLDIHESAVGLAAFQKKPEYGPGILSVTGLKITNVKLPYLVEDNSIIIVDKKRKDTNCKKVENMLYGAVYGKKSGTQ
ncbi:MAG TPA: CotH kinase family protein [archaeon]|nr:CotH kinase family protein [archaeon]